MKKIISSVIITLLTTIAIATADDKIAYTGYGSLIEDPRDLPITDKFTKTDLQLPIDFLRISGTYLGSSDDHDDTVYGALCNKTDPKRKDQKLYTYLLRLHLKNLPRMLLLLMYMKQLMMQLKINLKKFQKILSIVLEKY
ncbi:MAG: hypothetical protein ACI8TE_001110 [Francisella sp.]|jgi:hypothetical protein